MLWASVLWSVPCKRGQWLSPKRGQWLHKVVQKVVDKWSRQPYVNLYWECGFGVTVFLHHWIMYHFVQTCEVSKLANAFQSMIPWIILSKTSSQQRCLREGFALVTCFGCGEGCGCQRCGVEWEPWGTNLLTMWGVWSIAPIVGRFLYWWVPVLELSRNMSDNVVTLCCCSPAASFFDGRPVFGVIFQVGVP